MGFYINNIYLYELVDHIVNKKMLMLTGVGLVHVLLWALTPSAGQEWAVAAPDTLHSSTTQNQRWGEKETFIEFGQNPITDLMEEPKLIKPWVIVQEETRV